MVILGMDTTGNTLSVALSRDTTILGELTIHGTKKHSETLLPAVDALLGHTGLGLADVDVIAVSVGPGSFTGIRIGVATAKGLAHALNKKVAQIDTLDALIQNVFFNGTICAIMDARRSQVYAAAKNGQNVLVSSCAMEIGELLPRLGNGPVLFVGDGVDAYREVIKNELPQSFFADEPSRYQRASSVCMLGYKKSQTEELADYRQVQANYLRPSQAERLLGNEKV
jgi:tRNA threonylcarbamoyladenosine biosynthesis protein TsaB